MDRRRELEKRIERLLVTFAESVRSHAREEAVQMSEGDTTDFEALYYYQLLSVLEDGETIEQVAKRVVLEDETVFPRRSVEEQERVLLESRVKPVQSTLYVSSSGELVESKTGE